MFPHTYASATLCKTQPTPLGVVGSLCEVRGVRERQAEACEPVSTDLLAGPIPVGGAYKYG